MPPKRVDANQIEIVGVLRGMGCTVQHLHGVGKGVPDLLVGLRGRNLLVEIKSMGGRLNDLQSAWHSAWRGQVEVIQTAEQAAEFVTGIWSVTAPEVARSKWHQKK